MKKIFALALILALALSLAACDTGGTLPAASAAGGTAQPGPTEAAPAESAIQEDETRAATPSAAEPSGPPEENTFAQAYLNVLSEHEAAIKAHKPAADRGQVAIADINGDETPELIYMEDRSDPWPGFSQSGLYIWSCNGTEALPAFSNDTFFQEVGGSMNYAVVLTPANELYLYEAWGNETSEYIFNGYTLADGNLQEKEIFQYQTAPTEDYSGFVEKYQHGETVIDKAQYDALVSRATGADSVVLATSFQSPDQYWNLPYTAMTCDEAIVYLKKMSDPQASVPSPFDDYSQYYAPVLEQYRALALGEAFDGDTEPPWEGIAYDRSISAENSIADFGYALHDLNGDSLPELILLSPGISAVYSLVDNAPYLIDSFSYRYYCEKIGVDGTLYIGGSGGAADSSKGAYKIAPDGKSLLLVEEVGVESYDRETDQPLETPRYYKIDATGVKTIISEEESGGLWGSLGGNAESMDFAFTPLW